MTTASSQKVFALRKEGKLSEALAMARGLLQASPHDPWSKKALAWCLVDLAKQEANQQNLSALPPLIAEIESLADPEDEILQNALARLKARQHRDDVKNLLAELKEIAQRFREGEEEETKQAACGQDAIHLLRRYYKLPNVKRSCIDHSLVLRYACKLAPVLPNFLDFVDWWDLSLLRDEDFVPFSPPNAKSPLPSLAEMVGKALNEAWPNAHNREKHLPWIDAFFARAREKQPGSLWLAYYHAFVLATLNRHEAARNALLPLLAAKSHEAWVWGALGEVSSDRPELEMGALSIALDLCGHNPGFSITYRQRLATLLIARGELGAAHIDVEQAIAIRKSKGWKIHEDLQHQWKTVEKIPADSDKREALLLEAQKSLLQTICPSTADGIVSRIDEKHHIAHIATAPNAKVTCAILREPLQPGEVVRAYILTPEASQTSSRALFVERIPNAPIPSFARAFSGVLKKNPKGFGFVEEIFISPPLAKPFEDGARVKGLAIQSPHPKTGKLAWQAVRCNQE